MAKVLVLSCSIAYMLCLPLIVEVRIGFGQKITEFYNVCVCVANFISNFYYWSFFWLIFYCLFTDVCFLFIYASNYEVYRKYFYSYNYIGKILYIRIHASFACYVCRNYLRPKSL